MRVPVSKNLDLYYDTCTLKRLTQAVCSGVSKHIFDSFLQINILYSYKNTPFSLCMAEQPSCVLNDAFSKHGHLQKIAA